MFDTIGTKFWAFVFTNFSHEFHELPQIFKTHRIREN